MQEGEAGDPKRATRIGWTFRHRCWFILANYLAGHVLAKYFPSSINLAFRVEVASIT